MVELPHTIVGAVIAYKIGNPALSLPLAFASHFLIDGLIPHWNPHLNTEKKTHGKITGKTTTFVSVDTLISLAVGLYLATRVLPDIPKFVVIVLGCFLAVLPDVIEGPYFFFNFNHTFLKKFMDWHTSIQRDSPFWPGVITQVVVSGAALWWFFS